jgi:hypothetical protein
VTDEWARRRKRTRSSPELAEGDIELLREAGVVIPECIQEVVGLAGVDDFARPQTWR